MSLLLWILLASNAAWGAACCGSNGLFPSLIAGQERTQVSLTATTGQTVAEADPQGAIQNRAADDIETRHGLRLDAATLLSDRWQLGVNVPLVARYRDRTGVAAQSFGVGDVGASIAWEMLPEWTYSRWRPKGLVFGGVSLATGQGPFASEALYKIDATGRGYSTAFVGFLIHKGWRVLDMALLSEAHLPLGGPIDLTDGEVQLHPGWGATASLALGVNWGNFRLGTAVTWNREAGRRTTGLIESSGAATFAWPVTLQASYLLSEAWSLSALYSDGTLLGGVGQPLNRTLALVLQTRWQR